MPALFDPADVPGLLDEIREVVLLSRPETPNDAALVLAAVSRLVAATLAAGEPVVLDQLLSEFGLNRWVGRALATGMTPSVVAVHRGKLDRLVRVKRGLPARIEVRGKERVSREVIDWEDLLRSWSNPQLQATLLVAVGAGAPAAEGVGGTIERVDEGGFVVVWPDGSRRAVVEALWPSAERLVGLTVKKGSWARVRAAASEVKTPEAMLTFAVLACSEPRSLGSTIQRYGLTRRILDSVVRVSEPPVLDDCYRLLLR